MSPSGVRAGEPRELEEAMSTLSRLGASLVESYQALERRAERVEEELSRTNVELERKVAELDRVTRHLEAVLEALPTGVVVRDASGRVLRANDAALAILAAPEDEIVGARAHPLLARAESAIPDSPGPWEQREICRPDGRRLVLASRRSPVAGTARAGTVEILDDRTELVELAERLHGLDKLAALGNMAGGIAHELRNPMNAIKGFAALLARRLEPGTREHHWAARIVDGTTEADRILTSMLALAAPESTALEAVDGAELVAEAVEIALAEALGEMEPGRWRIGQRSTAPPFAGDRLQLRQAARNLIANALEAQPEGGAVEVSLELEGDEVRLRVADAGPGVPAELARRVLDPFFTTRAQGTGLGLSLVSTIAQRHSGRVEVSARPSHLGGAEVVLAIPFRPAS